MTAGEHHEFGGAWTELKLDAIDYYLRFYTKALSGKFCLWYGVRPFRWTASCCGFDQALGVLILEVDGAAVAEG